MKLKSVELVNALSAAFEQLQVLTQTSVNINQNVVKAEQGNFLLFARFIDTFYIEDGSRPSDQMVFEFFKTLTDDYVAADLAAKTFNKTLTDNGYTTDRDKISFIKGAFEEIATTDEYYFEFSKALNGLAASILDDQEMQFRKLTTDVAGVAESFYRQINFARAYSDAAGTVDDQSFVVGKYLVDVPTASDSINMLTGKQLYDIPAASENLAKSFTRPRSDSALLGDATIVAAGKVLPDLASTTDAGSLRSQGYSDFTYFSEDYVGASTTF